MLRENHVAKQQRIGERLTRAMAKAHMDRRELSTLTGYSEAQIMSWERGRAELYPTDPDNAVPCTRREAGVAPVLGATPAI
jgi:transcriptional regulator with XRE-family HTH domain